MTMASSTVTFTRGDLDLIVAFAGCSLDEKPGSNWVQGAGGLPDYICRIARAIKRTGKTTSQAISIAVSRVKVWASGVGVDKDTQAKAAEAVAAWEALRAKSHVKTAAKKTVKASNSRRDMLCLADTSFNTDLVRQAWSATASQWEQGNAGTDTSPAINDYDDDSLSGPDAQFRANAYIRELWTDFLIVESVDGDLYRVDYEVGDPDNDGDIDVTFDNPVPVKVDYVTMSAADLLGHDISDTDLLRIVAFTPRCEMSAIDEILAFSQPRKTALEQVLALAADKDTGNQYGNVAYADVKNKKYPIDTKAHVQAALSYFAKPGNQKGYSPAEIAAIKAKIQAAAKKFGITTNDD